MIVKSPPHLQSCTAKGQFLVVEDNPADAELIQVMLEGSYHNQADITLATTLQQATSLLNERKFDAILLDLHLPDSSGAATVSAVSKLNPNTAILVLTGTQDESIAVEALSSGAQDYLSKNEVSSTNFSRSIRYAQERKAIELKLKAALEETADRNQKLEQSAHHDFLTTLPNRAYFDSQARRTLFRAARTGSEVALIYFDINKFKEINDSLGHSTGDELLRQVAARAKTVVRSSDFIARLGGDEFVIIADITNHKNECYALVERVLSCFAEPFTVNTQEIFSSASVGVAFYPDAGTLETLIQRADLAMYEAKKNAGNVCFFTATMETTYARTMSIKSELSNAVTNREFSAEFQAYYPLEGKGNLCAEALARWTSPTLGKVGPNDFIPVVERSPVNNALTRRIVAQCGDLLAQAEQSNLKLDRININVSASQLIDRSFASYLLRWFAEDGIDPERICIEITEREMINNIDACKSHINLLRDKGVSIALDDFGSGYSSITHLLSLPIDSLKLDQMLVKDVQTNTRHQALNAGIAEMAHRLGMRVIAEGVETLEEYNTMKNLGYDYFQGWYFSRASSIETFLKEHLATRQQSNHRSN